MKKTLLTLLFICLAQAFVLAQNSAEKAITKMENDWAAAVTKADTAALEKIFDDTLVYTHSSGLVDDKAKYISNIKTGYTKYEEVTFEDYKVRFYGDTAISYTTARIRAVSNGNPVNNHLKMIHIYVKRGKDWKMVAHQATRLPQ
ncbi:MAG TPA: nuclear transport factor 2 family protein [Blastocatellia bacterium]|nr:nuclear transport factor 2 family protein [Blastocatellia bacterium]